MIAIIFFLIVQLSLVAAFSVGYKGAPSSFTDRSRLITTLRAEIEEIDILDKPKWTSGGPISDLVNVLINFKPLMGVLKVGARGQMIGTAEKAGVPWRDRSEKLERDFSKDLLEYYNEIEKKDMVYPNYYTQAFHAYDEGNLNWLAAYECESATMSMAVRVYPNEGLNAQMAQDRLRNSYFDAVTTYIENKGNKIPSKILDVGCSVGVSTFYLAKRFPKAEIIDGLDLCPHFLATAKHKQALTVKLLSWGSDQTIDLKTSPYSDLNQYADSSVERLRWLHRNAEATGLPDNEYDFTSASFVLHELPDEATNNIFKEMFRITSKGGTIAITDNDPRSKIIQSRPAPIAVLLKFTEPWSDQYYAYDLEGALRNAGFTDITTKATDQRHRTVIGTKPSS
jgi:ubiquinone/menaquinone biosynthesis C-methylase UbiE